MKKTDKMLLYGIAAVVAAGGLCVGCLVAAVFLPFSWLYHGGAAGAAKKFLRSNAVVRARLGEIKDFGWFPSGTVEVTNGAGKAHLVFSLKGTRGQGQAAVDLSKKAGRDWKVTAATLTVGEKEYILRKAPAALPGTPASPQPPGGESGYPKSAEDGLAA